MLNFTKKDERPAFVFFDFICKKIYHIVMEENPKFISGIPQKIHKETEIEIERKQDLETAKFVGLFNFLLEVKKYSRKYIMKFIEQYTGGTASAVVERWLDNNVPFPSLQKGIMSAMEELKTLPVPENVSAPVSKLETTKDPSLEKPRLRKTTRREQIIIDNEEKLRILTEKLKAEGKIF
jgi:hypothetical protein